MNPEQLVRRRTELGLTQGQVACAAGMAKQAYGRLEKSGRPNPRINTAEVLALVLNCKVDDLLAPAPKPRKPRKG